MIKTLKNLSGILDKMASHASGKQLEWHPKGMQEENLLQSRIISDMFPFVKQVQVACDNGKGGAARLAGIEPPAFEDNEKSVAELKARIDKTVKFMATIKPADVIGHEDRKFSLSYWPDKQMTAFGYATEYLLPNFYFHVTVSYAILRKNGVDLGKADYTGPMPFID